MAEFKHSPVLFDDVLRLLVPRPGMCVVDCTLGLGGHARGLLDRIVPGGVLIGIDADKSAIEIAKRQLRREGARIFFFHSRFADLDKCVEASGKDSADIFLFDLGVSSMQLDDFDRGFSFRKEAFLDMRMDKGAFLTASDIVNSFSESELVDIFVRFGEEKAASRIARAIVLARRRKKIDTTRQLADIVESVVGTKRGRLHPATRVFQALRIVVNDELSQLREGLNKAFMLTAPGGRIGVISFHSLEDRLVKRAFKNASLSGGWRPVTKKPIRPSSAELKLNPRARSSRFRVIERQEVAV